MGISDVSFNFIPCVELEIPGGGGVHPQAASGILRQAARRVKNYKIKLLHGLVNYMIVKKLAKNNTSGRSKQRSKMELFAKIVTELNPLIIYRKKLHLRCLISSSYEQT